MADDKTAGYPVGYSSPITTLTARMNRGSDSTCGGPAEVRGPVGVLGLGTSSRRPDSHITPGRSFSKCSHGRLLLGDDGEGVVAEVLHGVQVGDAVAVVLWQLADVIPQLLGRRRTGGVRVRVVALPGHVVHVEEIPAGYAEGVVDKAGNHVV